MLERYINKKIELFLGSLWNNFTEIKKDCFTDIYELKIADKFYYLRGNSKLLASRGIRKQVSNLVLGDYVLYKNTQLKIRIDDIKKIEDSMIFYDIFNKKPFGKFNGIGYCVKTVDDIFLYNFYISILDEFEYQKKWRTKKEKNEFVGYINEIMEKFK